MGAIKMGEKKREMPSSKGCLILNNSILHISRLYTAGILLLACTHCFEVGHFIYPYQILPIFPSADIFSPGGNLFGVYISDNK